MSRAAFLALAILAFAGCDRPAPALCQPWTVRPCTCGGDRAGAQACGRDGHSWLTCRCEVAEEPTPAPAAPDEEVAHAAGEPVAISPDGRTPLPPPRLEGGRPLMEVLRDRRSSRAFSGKRLPAQLLADLLWAGAGVNRPESGKRTAPSARNRQEIDLYAATPDGLFLYDPATHALETLSTGDVRALTGTQPFVAAAPLDLVYVADRSRMETTVEEDVLRYSGADAAFMAENVYLLCASAGLATVVRGSIDRAALGEAMGLRANQTIVLAQTVGYEATAAEQR